jgi:nucleoside-diphosphate-sugar epimerase
MEEDIYLVVGATGGCGYHITKELISRGKRVSIVIRDHNKAQKLFKDIWDKFEGVYVIDFTKEHWNKDIIHAIEDSKGVISYVISNLAATSDTDVKEMYMYNYEINRRLIYAFKKIPLKNFVFISSFLTDNPSHHIAKRINKYRFNSLGYKNLVEVYLKLSGLRYTIIRPGKLEEFEDSQPSYFEVKQDDKVPGFITRATVGKAVADFLETNTNNVQFEILTNKDKLKEPYINPFPEYNFKTYDLKHTLIHNHKGVQIFEKYNTFCLSTMFIGFFLKFTVHVFRRYKINRI